MNTTWMAVGLSMALAGCAEANDATARQPLTSDAPATPANAPLATSAPKAPEDAGIVPVVATSGSTPTSASGPTSPTQKTDRAAEYREVTLPAGTMLPIVLNSSVGSDSSHVEDAVQGTLRRAVLIRGVQVLPAGTKVLGHVTSARHSARVKGRASVGFRFSQIDLPGPGGRSAMRTGTITRVAPATKGQDAAKIGGGAAGGAIIGGILGGGSGAAKGAAIGGGAGTAVVLSTKGKEVHLGPGAPLSTRLTAPLTVRVPR